jgi:hypothetical protein
MFKILNLDISGKVDCLTFRGCFVVPIFLNPRFSYSRLFIFTPRFFALVGKYNFHFPNTVMTLECISSTDADFSFNFL